MNSIQEYRQIWVSPKGQEVTVKGVSPHFPVGSANYKPTYERTATMTTPPATSSDQVLLAVDWYILKGYNKKPRTMYQIRQLFWYRRKDMMVSDNVERITREECEEAAKLIFEAYGEKP